MKNIFARQITCQKAIFRRGARVISEPVPSQLCDLCFHWRRVFSGKELYRVGSLMTISRELSRYRLD
jgi:hypothetical protein